MDDLESLLRDGLKARPPEIPAEVDHAVRDAAARQLRVDAPRSGWQRPWLRAASAAAVLVVAAWATIWLPSQPPAESSSAGPAAPGGGARQVASLDFVECYRVAWKARRGGAEERGSLDVSDARVSDVRVSDVRASEVGAFDVNADGVVDERDVRQVARLVVRLPETSS